MRTTNIEKEDGDIVRVDRQTIDLKTLQEQLARAEEMVVNLEKMLADEVATVNNIKSEIATFRSLER